MLHRDELSAHERLKRPTGFMLPVRCRNFSDITSLLRPIDIQLINGDRGIIAEKQESIREVSPREQDARNRLYSYVASSPLEIARQATSIQVTYSPFSHKDHLDPSARASAGNRSLSFSEHVRQRIRPGAAMHS
jgi:hypothetical protein